MERAVNVLEILGDWGKWRRNFSEGFSLFLGINKCNVTLILMGRELGSDKTFSICNLLMILKLLSYLPLGSRQGMKIVF